MQASIKLGYEIMISPLAMIMHMLIFLLKAPIYQNSPAWGWGILCSARLQLKKNCKQPTVWHLSN